MRCRKEFRTDKNTDDATPPKLPAGGWLCIGLTTGKSVCVVVPVIAALPFASIAMPVPLAPGYQKSPVPPTYVEYTRFVRVPSILVTKAIGSVPG